MCDTMVMLGNATKNGHVYFAKNSDRHPNEAQAVFIIPGREHSPSELQECTYIKVPQVKKTFTVLISKPFWMWGCEMGANEFGVVIGNEAVFTKEGYEKQTGLTGMDLIRLALQRATNSRDALTTITTLLSEFGQGGNCGYGHAMFYHNSFIIADPSEAWVLETAGKHWAAKKVENVYTISNAITLQEEFDLASDNLVTNAVEKGWTKDKRKFNFAKDYSDFIYTHFSDAHSRRVCSLDLMKNQIGSADISRMFSALQTHEVNKDSYNPGKKLTGAQVCMHSGFGPVRESQSVASLVADLSDHRHTYWLTGTSAPCTGVFKPVWMDSGLPDTGQPTGRYDSESLFWQHELLHRRIIKNYSARITLGNQQQSELQAQFFNGSLEVEKLGAAARREFSENCFHQAAQLDKEWIDSIDANSAKENQSLHFQLAWRKFNRQAGIEELLSNTKAK